MQQHQQQSTCQEEHILLLGEADCSFARAIGQRGGLDGICVTATELGTPSDVCSRYFGGCAEALAARCDELNSYGIRVVLGVDVTRLECNDRVHAWDAASRVFIEMPLWRSDGVGDASTAMAATSCPASLVVFNFPHTTRPGKMAKLLMQMFRSLRCCIAAGFAKSDCRVEMRLRHVSSEKDEGQLIRSRYGHEEAAAASLFDVLSVSESDLEELARYGYEHRLTKRNVPCGHLERVQVWRWMAAALGPPSVQRLPDGTHGRRDVFYAPEAILDRRVAKLPSWKGSVVSVPQYLVRWRGHPEESEQTWEASKDLDIELRKAFDEARALCVRENTMIRAPCLRLRGGMAKRVSISQGDSPLRSLLSSYTHDDSADELAARVSKSIRAGEAHVERSFLEGDDLNAVRAAANATLAGGRIPPGILVAAMAIERLRVSLIGASGRPLLESAELTLLGYKAGGSYRRHMDDSSNVAIGHGARRSLSLLVYLGDDDWDAQRDGGALRIYPPKGSGREGYVDVPPYAGTLVVFDSATVPHEVLVTNRPRVALAGWLQEAR